MTKTDIARRVYNHAWKLDPIVRSLLDTDFYKLLMLQMIWGLYPKVDATFSLINRARSVRLADEIDEGELREQLDHARTLRFTKKEMIWLAGNTFYGRKQIFQPDFLAWLTDFRLPPYELSKKDGQYELEFRGPWMYTTLWEIPALAIINELRSRAAMKSFGPFALDVLYARAKAKMWAKTERLRELPDLKISDFGTRRRHSFLWQRWCVEALKEGIGSAFTGTSNVLLAMDTDLEALGTNAHELPMVFAALTDSEEDLLRSPYRVLEDWQRYYGGNLLIVLPDTFGTEAFLRNAPDWVADWTGFRPDSAKRPRSAAEAADLLGRTRRRHHHRHAPALPRQGAHVVRLGYEPDQRFRGMRALRHQPPQRDLAGLQGRRRQRPAGRQTLRQSRQGHRRARSDRALHPPVRAGGTGRAGRLCLRGQSVSEGLHKSRSAPPRRPSRSCLPRRPPTPTSPTAASSCSCRPATIWPAAPSRSR